MIDCAGYLESFTAAVGLYTVSRKPTEFPDGISTESNRIATRHTYATMLLISCVNINFVASQLGHSPIMTATVYSKWMTGEADKAEMAKLNTVVIDQKRTEKNNAKKELAGNWRETVFTLHK